MKTRLALALALSVAASSCVSSTTMTRQCRDRAGRSISCKPQPRSGGSEVVTVEHDLTWVWILLGISTVAGLVSYGVAASSAASAADWAQR